MGFTFRLESVLKFRQRIVDKQGHEVALAQAQVTACRTRLADLERNIAQHMMEASGQLGSGLRVQDMVAKTVWLEHLRQLKKEMDAELVESTRELLAARTRLNAAWRDLEVLEQLKIKQGSDWLEHIEAVERKELDEIGQIRADRARRSNLAAFGE